MAMLLQDPYSGDGQGEYLHEDYQFPLEQDFLVGMGSSKFMVRDSPDRGDGLDWRDNATLLGYEDFKKRASSSSLRSIVDDPQFRQVNAFAVASHTLQKIEEALDRKITWRTRRPVVIRTHAPEAAGDAYYDSFSSSLNFGFSEPSGSHAEGLWTCLSHDIVSHEVGHAIWDSFMPLFVYSAEIDAHALHESFGDLTALFSKLEHESLVKRLYRGSRGNGGVDTPSCSSFRYTGPTSPYWRGHLNPDALKHQDYVLRELQGVHERSTVWTEAICEILDELLKTLVSAETETREGNPGDLTKAVVCAADQTRRALLRALHYVPPSGVTIPLLARLFCEADERLSPEDSTIHKIAKEVFEKRVPRASDIRLDRVPVDTWQAWVEDFEKADTAFQTRLVIKQAEALRIPLDKRPCLLTPRLIRANREIYLYFAYELVDTIDAPIYERRPRTTPETVCWGPTGKEERVRVPSYYGGTLVMDEKFEKAGILVTDPPAAMADTRGVPPALQPARPTDKRLEVITSDLGYLLRHIQGYYKTQGFAGFDWPEFDEQKGERAVTSHEEEPRRYEGLEPDPIVEKLVPDPSEPAIPAIVLTGLLGRSARDGYWRLYFTAELDEYTEFREEDVIHHEPMGQEHPPFVGLESTKLWVKRDAEVMNTRIGSPSQVQATFLAGDIATGSTAGTTAGPLGAEPAGVPLIAPTESVWCPPTSGPRCATFICWTRRCW
jgi:hypothetical protein